MIKSFNFLVEETGGGVLHPRCGHAAAKVEMQAARNARAWNVDRKWTMREKSRVRAVGSGQGAAPGEVMRSRRLEMRNVKVGLGEVGRGCSQLETCQPDLRQVRIWACSVSMERRSM